MSTEIEYSEDNNWSSFNKFAAELSVGSKLTYNGLVIKKVTDELWECNTESNKISYSNHSIDSFKSIESVEFNVETA